MQKKHCKPLNKAFCKLSRYSLQDTVKIRIRKQITMTQQNETTVLLVDPETEIRSLVTERLEKEGYRCLHADSLSQAREIFTQSPVALIISEIDLPDGSGLEFLIATDETETHNKPIIYLASYGGIEQVKETIRAGAFDYLEKPVDLNNLVNVAKRAINLQGKYLGPERRTFTTLEPTQPRWNVVDKLTNLASHRFVMEKIPEIYAQCRKQAIPLSMCLIDVDNFREFNDRNGLDLGDLALIEIGKRLRHLTRREDIIARYGGDEFLLVLPGANKAASSKLAHRIIENFRKNPWKIAAQTIIIELCIGVLEINIDEYEHEMELLDRVIEAAYHARFQGPGSVVIWKPSLSKEIALEYNNSEQDELMPDYEATNIMMWRFRELNRQISTVSMETLRILVAAVEARDPYTKDHSVRVASFSRHIAEELDLPQTQVSTIYSAAMLHDIGKIGISDNILTKPGKLTAKEYELIKQHPIIGVSILEQTRFFVSELALVKHHHERFDGKGYPDGLSGEEIPLGSRIISVADAVEAMLARRSYKDNYDLEFTVNQLIEGAGKQFDPAITAIAIKIIKQGILTKLWQSLQSEKLVAVTS